MNELPTEWTCWHDSVRDLTTAISDHLTQSRPPAPSADTTAICDALAACQAAAEEVGDEGRRMSVSVKLHRVHANAVMWAQRVLANPNADQLEHGQARMHADRLRREVEDPNIVDEMSVAAIRAAEAGEVIRAATEEFMRLTAEEDSPPADAVPWPEYMSARDLADRLGLDRDATRQRLSRLAERFDCFIENESPRRGESRRLYRVEDVRHHLQ